MIVFVLGFLVLAHVPCIAFADAFSFDAKRAPTEEVKAEISDGSLLAEETVVPDTLQLQELSQTLPQTEEELMAVITHTFHSEHMLEVGPGLRTNTQMTHFGRDSWLFHVATQHVWMPAQRPDDFLKWVAILATQAQWPERRNDITAHAALSIPWEIWCSSWLQLRVVPRSEIIRRVRWDLEPDLPFLEAHATYVQGTPQAYLQIQFSRAVHLRLGAVARVRFAVQDAETFLGDLIANTADFVEIGPEAELFFPVSSALRVGISAALLNRDFSAIPFITQGPVALLGLKNAELFQTHRRAIVKVQYQSHEKYFVTAAARFHQMVSNEKAFDFLAGVVHLQVAIRLKRFWVMPEGNLFFRPFDNLNYPTDDLAAFGNIRKQDVVWNVGLRLAYEATYPKSEGFFFAVVFRYQQIRNDFVGTNALQLEALSNVDCVDLLFQLGLYL